MTAKAHDQILFQSKLPFFKYRAGPLHEYGCERTGCGKSFYTAVPLELQTAPCPYCMRTSRVPDQ